jgi:predicted nucleic acid-binding protein
MIVVVADTSPLNYLIQIECETLLPALYERVIVPTAVMQELAHPRTPSIVRNWAGHSPQWLEVRQVCAPSDAGLTGLDPGERAAIQLAQEVHADLLLMDERMGVKLAKLRGLEVTGTLGVLVTAARKRLVDIDVALAKLQETDFRCTPQLLGKVKFLAQQ